MDDESRTKFLGRACALPFTLLPYCSSRCHECAILGNPGATSRDDAIVSGERYFRAKVYFESWRAPGSPALKVNFRPKISLARNYRIVPASSPWVSEDASVQAQNEIQTVGCWMLASRMSDLYKSDVGFLQVGCPIFTSRMSDFNKSDVGYLQVGRRIFTRRMLDVGCRIFKVGCRMAPISFRRNGLHFMTGSSLRLGPGNYRWKFSVHQKSGFYSDRILKRSSTW